MLSPRNKIQYISWLFGWQPQIPEKSVPSKTIRFLIKKRSDFDTFGLQAPRASNWVLFGRPALGRERPGEAEAQRVEKPANTKKT